MCCLMIDALDKLLSGVARNKVKAPDSEMDEEKASEISHQITINLFTYHHQGEAARVKTAGSR